MVRGRYSSSEPTSGTIGAPHIQTPSQAEYGLEGDFASEQGTRPNEGSGSPDGPASPKSPRVREEEKFMRTIIITIAFTMLALLRLQSDGAIVEMTDGKMIRHSSLATWYAKQISVSPQLTIKDGEVSSDGRTLLLLMEGEAQPSVHRGK